jgi:hypothetical protein
MVGRDAEFGALCDAWRATAGFVKVSGGAGMGKSRLTREFGTWARARGAVVLTGRCAPTAVDVPCRPLREALLAAARSGRRPGEDLGPFVPARRLTPQSRPYAQKRETQKAEPTAWRTRTGQPI